MNEGRPFTDPDDVASMESEHLALWRAFLRSCARPLPPDTRVMDFGCNRGGMLRLLFDRDPGDPGRAAPAFGLGVDVDTVEMRTILAQAANAVGGRYPLLFTTGDPAGFPGQFDLVLSHEVLYLLPDLPRTLSGIRDALAPGGRACFTTGCHADNPHWPRWRASLASMGLLAPDRDSGDYADALRRAGFADVRLDRLRLTVGEYEEWVRNRTPTGPNPAWFPDAAAEREYYTRTGKMLLTGRRD